MAWRPAALCAAALWLAACPPPPPVAAPRPEPAADCPEPPAAMSSIEEVKELSRAVRELRANLMARVEGPGPATAPAGADEEQGGLYATLHPAELTLAEAALANPRAARKLEPGWLRGHLLGGWVELRSATPLPGLDGELGRLQLLDGSGRAHAAIELEVVKDSQGLIYRIAFPASAFDPGGQLDRLRLTLRLALDGAPRSASWTVPRQSLESVDGLPLVFPLAPLRNLRWARWLLLGGELAEARRQATEVRACAPELAPAIALDDLLRATPSSAEAPERIRVDLTALARLDHLGVVAELGHAPAADLSRRATLLTRVEERAGRWGLLPERELEAARGALREAALALQRGELGWGLAAALHRFDQALGRCLAAALDPLAAPGRSSPGRGLLLEGLPPAGDVERELARRVAQANARLIPIWIQSPRDPDPERVATAPRFRRAELRPVLELKGENGRSLVELHERLGWGWTSSGVAAAPGPRVRFEDRGSAYWRGVLADGRAPLRASAERLLELALSGPEEGSELAMVGLARLRGAAFRPLLLAQLAERAPSHRAQGALRALGRIPGQESSAALAQAVRSPSAALRAAAFAGLGVRGLAEERGLLRAGLTDADPLAATEALEALLRAGDAEGIATARRWLVEGERRPRALRAIAALRGGGSSGRSLAAGLANALLGLLAKEADRDLLAAAASLLGARALPALSQLYERDASLRAAIVALPEVAGAAGDRLLRRAAADPSAELRRLALPKLAGLKNPPRALLEEAAKDADRGVRLAAHVALAKLGRTESLLALGEGARGSCEERALTLTPLAEAMEPGSRRKLLVDALAAPCAAAHRVALGLLARFHAQDGGLLRTVLSHPRRELRVRAALVAVGLSSEAVAWR